MEQILDGQENMTLILIDLEKTYGDQQENQYEGNYP